MCAYHGNSGYVGRSMSKRAEEAYESGEKPISKWGKGKILSLISTTYGKEAGERARKLTLAELRERFLRYGSWHHTGKFFRKTDFYRFAEGMEEEELEKALVPGACDRQAREVCEKWALVRYEEWERVAVNRFGRLAWRKRIVTAVATWKEVNGEPGMALLRLDPRGQGFQKRLPSLTMLEDLGSKPRANARIWKRCGEAE